MLFIVVGNLVLQNNIFSEDVLSDSCVEITFSFIEVFKVECS